MNEMKPEDVMRALECCGNMDSCEKNCPLHSLGGIEYCIHTLMLNALALLREKDAHIKMLHEDRMGWADEAVKAQMQVNEKDAEVKGLVDGWSKDQDRFEQVCAEKDAEIERLITLNSQLEAKVFEERNARSEAITEFCQKKGINYVEDDFR